MKQGKRQRKRDRKRVRERERGEKERGVLVLENGKASTHLFLVPTRRVLMGFSCLLLENPKTRILHDLAKCSISHLAARLLLVLDAPSFARFAQAIPVPFLQPLFALLFYQNFTCVPPLTSHFIAFNIGLITPNLFFFPLFKSNCLLKVFI